jgi:DNA-binding transcriptional LysR family regulator
VDRFDSMAAFVAVAEHKGFAQAARRLGVSTSSVTRLVSQLETHLGVRLLNRTTRAVSLTDAGARFLERARRILGDLEEAERSAEDERGEPVGRLVISAPLMFGRLHVAPLLSAYMQSHPRVAGELILNDRFANLTEEGIDIAVRIGNLPDSGDVVRKVGATRRVLVAAPGYLDREGAPTTPGALAQHRLIAFTALAPGRAWRFQRGDGQVEVDVTPSFTTNNGDAAIAHALTGGGITMALSYQVVDQIKAGALRTVLEEFEPAPYPIQLMYPDSRLLSVKVRTFVDLAVSARHWWY